MSLILKICVLIIVLELISCLDWRGGLRCNTPDGAISDCVPLEQCLSIMNVIQGLEEPIPQNIYQYINSYSCSYDSVSYVCCPQGPIDLNRGNILDNYTPPLVASYKYLNRPAQNGNPNEFNIFSRQAFGNRQGEFYAHWSPIPWAKWVIDDEGCRTPDGDVGDCIPVRQCRPMIEALRTLKKPLSKYVSQRLNGYSCSFNNNAAHVCCPQGPIIIRDESTYVENVSPPDVSKHRNIGLLPTDCGYLDEDKNRIRNGDNAEINEFPWMALLSYRTRSGPNFKCGGTIVNDRYILTAAHCIQNLETPLLGVRVGEYNIKTIPDCALQKDNKTTICTPGHQDLAIEEINAHPLFNATIISNDIGLIRVSRMNLNLENIRPVCLPTGDLRNQVLKFVTVTGWGVTDVVTGATSAILQKVNLPVMDLESCKKVYQNQSRAHLTYRQVCAGGKKKQDSCPGDSGGPLHQAVFTDGQAKYIQQGVVSFGPRECGLEGYPGVYTRVAYYMDWILDTIRP